MKDKQKRYSGKTDILKEDIKRFLTRFIIFSVGFVILKDNTLSITGIKRCFFEGFFFTGIIEIGDILSVIAIEDFRLSRVFNVATSTTFWIPFSLLYYCTLFSYYTFKEAIFTIFLSILYALAELFYWYFT